MRAASLYATLRNLLITIRVALRRIAPTLPVAVLTGHAYLRTAALLRHADEFLIKPVRVAQLLATATALTERATGQ